MLSGRKLMVEGLAVERFLVVSLETVSEGLVGVLLLRGLVFWVLEMKEIPG